MQDVCEAICDARAWERALGDLEEYFGGWEPLASPLDDSSFDEHVAGCHALDGMTHAGMTKKSEHVHKCFCMYRACQWATTVPMRLPGSRPLCLYALRRLETILTDRPYHPLPGERARNRQPAIFIAFTLFGMKSGRVPD